MLNCEIDNGAEPVFVMVNDFEEFWPSTTLPKLKLAGDTANPGCTPAPLTEIVSGEFGASLATVTDPLTLPAEVGANVTDNVAVAEGFNVAGAVTPLTETPAPVAVTAEIFTAAVPEFVNVTCFTELAPVFTLPKLKLLWLDWRFPVGAAVPVPLSGIVNGDPVALLVTVTEPLTAPVAVGANLTDKVAVAEGFKVAGVEIPVAEKPVPETDIAEICTAAAPVLVKTICLVRLLPLVTLPNAKLLWFACKLPVGAAVPVPLSATVVVGCTVSLLEIVNVPVAAP
jgi:hypothetical protein